MATPNTTFVAGNVLTAAQQNSFPFGCMGLQNITTSTASSSPHTTFQDNGMTLTITEISGRRYRITAKTQPYPNGGLQGISFRLMRNATTLLEWNLDQTVLSTSSAYDGYLSYVYTSTASGSATYKMQFKSTTSNTQSTDFGDATFPRQFDICDIGNT
jgi:hypothetical protein